MKKASLFSDFSAFPTKKVIRKMGLSGDQNGIMQRYINEEGNWNEHLNNSKNFIKELFSTRTIDSIAILGSGWLLDVPLDFLAENCKKIFLYDIRHPQAIINKVKKHKNVELVTMDITGGIISLIYNKVKRKEFSDIEIIPEILFNPIEEIDYIVSVNLLSQLDILIVEYLRSFSQVKAEQIISLREKIQQNHLKSLPKKKSSLICDYEELIFDRTNNKIGNSSLIFIDFPVSVDVQEWIWRFDTNMTYHPNRITHFKVKALQL